mmetsp:Transcript_20131/g.56127  ORF Transcript_20131/g.56127 Transcript_20131/m.56127 type:complete len:251 (-) Transcript_20131:6-758(-)
MAAGVALRPCAALCCLRQRHRLPGWYRIVWCHRDERAQDRAPHDLPRHVPPPRQRLRGPGRLNRSRRQHDLSRECISSGLQHRADAAGPDVHELGPELYAGHWSHSVQLQSGRAGGRHRFDLPLLREHDDRLSGYIARVQEDLHGVQGCEANRPLAFPPEPHQAPEDAHSLRGRGDHTHGVQPHDQHTGRSTHRRLPPGGQGIALLDFGLQCAHPMPQHLAHQLRPVLGLRPEVRALRALEGPEWRGGWP